MPTSYQTRIGIRREASWGAGTATGGSPPLMLPVTEISLGLPYENIVDNAMRGIAAKDFAAYKGASRVEGNIGLPVYADMIGYLLLGMMGTVNTTAAGSPPYVHVFTTSDSPPSFFVDENNGVTNWRYRGVMVAELGFRFNTAEGLVTCTASLFGKDRAGTAVTVSYREPDSPWRGAIINSSLGTQTAFPLIEGEINMARELAMIHTANTGGVPGLIVAGPPEVTGRFTCSFDSTYYDDLYQQVFQGTFTVIFMNEAAYAGTASSVNSRYLRFRAPRIHLGDSPAELNRSQIWVQQTFQFRALHDNSFGGPCDWTLGNNYASYAV